MPHTVAAIFESETQADQARSELINLGIPRDDIYVRYDSEQARQTASTDEAGDSGGIGGFFKRLFGFEDDDDRATYYSQAIGEGRYLVAVDAPSDEQAERAADVMQRLGALDIDDDIEDLSPGASAARRSARVFVRNHDISPEEKASLRDESVWIPPPGATVQRTGQLAAEDAPPLHPHLETMDDDPYGESMSTKPKQQK